MSQNISTIFAFLSPLSNLQSLSSWSFFSPWSSFSSLSLLRPLNPLYIYVCFYVFCSSRDMLPPYCLHALSQLSAPGGECPGAPHDQARSTRWRTRRAGEGTRLRCMSSLPCPRLSETGSLRAQQTNRFARSQTLGFVFPRLLRLRLSPELLAIFWLCF